MPVNWDDVPEPPQVPKPPPFGWIVNPRKLTGDELETIRQLVGDPDKMRMGRFLAYTAIAYARRYDEAAYPWEAAGRIPLDELPALESQTDPVDGDGLTEDEAEAHAQAVAEAIEAAEEPPDPA